MATSNVFAIAVQADLLKRFAPWTSGVRKSMYAGGGPCPEPPGRRGPCREDGSGGTGQDKMPDGRLRMDGGKDRYTAGTAAALTGGKSNYAEHADDRANRRDYTAITKSGMQVPVTYNTRLKSKLAMQHEQQAWDQLLADPEGMLKSYIENNRKANGQVSLNTDDAREEWKFYREDRTRSADVHEPASALNKLALAQEHAHPSAPDELENSVTHTAGGTGTGKTTAMRKAAEKALAEGHADRPSKVVYDSNMNGTASAIKRVNAGLAKGDTQKIVYVHRGLESSFDTMIDRADNMQSELGSGRTVPVKEHISTHIGAPKTLQDMHDIYANNKTVEFRFIDNSGGRDDAHDIPIEDGLKIARSIKIDPVAAEKTLRAQLDKRWQAGTVSRKTYTGIAGHAPPARKVVKAHGTQAIDGSRKSGGAGRGETLRAGNNKEVGVDPGTVSRKGAAQRGRDGETGRQESQGSEGLSADALVPTQLGADEDEKGTIDVPIEAVAYTNLITIGAPRTRQLSTLKALIQAGHSVRLVTRRPRMHVDAWAMQYVGRKLPVVKE